MMTREQKVQYVTGTLFEMLQHDLKTVLEARCGKHGVSGSGPNFTALLLCFVACEVAAGLSIRTDESKADSVRRFITRAGELANDSRYERFAGALFGIFRHGIAHTFL